METGLKISGLALFVALLILLFFGCGRVTMKHNVVTHVESQDMIRWYEVWEMCRKFGYGPGTCEWIANRLYAKEVHLNCKQEF